MKPKTAYNRLNQLLWRGQLPTPVIHFIDDATLPHCDGVTLLDRDFTRPVIFLNAGSRRWGKTLLHEMLHVAEPLLNHGEVFDAIVNRYWKISTTNIKGLNEL